MEIRYQCKGDCAITNTSRNQIVITDNEKIEFIDAENSERKDINIVIKDSDKQKEIKQLINSKRCPFCDNDLVEAIEVKQRKKLPMKFFLVGGTSLVVILIILSIFLFKPFKKSETLTTSDTLTTPPTSVQTNSEVAESLPPTQGQDIMEETSSTNKTVVTNTVTTTESKSGTSAKESNSLIFPNGNKYIGDIKNGKPSGVGAYYFKVQEQISKKDPKNRMGEPGDVLQGLWKDGYFVNGKLFDSQGNVKEVLILGTN